MPENARPISPPQMPRRGRKSEHPRMIGPWKIGRTIGKGAMGVVRIARHSKTGQYAAIKIMSKMQVIQSRRSLKNAEDDAERILLAIEREIVVMKLVDHPNIMRLYDVWETSGELYLILEYVEGGELFDYIIERGRLPESEALDYFQQLISAMDYCHRLNIAHRDLKPENLLLDKDKVLKVADFGMAAWQCGDNLLNTSCGSPHYAAPEVISSTPYDGAISDIWSCGVILFGMLAGRLPFDDEDICALLEKVSAGKFKMPTDIDPRAQDLLNKMLEKDVSSRIKIPEIMKHPWFTSQAPKHAHGDAPSLDEVSRPIKMASEIDVDIFGNLRTLWHGAPDEEIIEGLINEERTWEKVVYTLLMKYRAKCYENYSEELERARSQRRTERRQKRTQLEEEKKAKETSPCDRPSTPPPRVARPDPPTPRRATSNNRKDLRPASLPPPPGQIKLRPVAQRAAASDLTPNTPGMSFLSPSLLTPSILAASPLGPTSPASPIWQVLDVAPPLDVPELHDERVQRYLQEIIDRLNTMQKQPGVLSPMSSNGGTPALGAPFAIQPLQTQGKSRVPSTIMEDDPDPDFTYVLISQSEEEMGSRGLGISTAPRIIGKENEGHVLKKSSLRKKGDGGNRQALVDRHVQIVLPPPIQRSEGNHRRVSYDSYTSHSPTYSISEGSSFNVSSTPKVSWFTNLFKPRHESFRLMSLHDLNTTREECRRLLANAGVNFVLMDDEDPRVTFLRCHLDEVRDPAGVMSVVKAVKFRVEVRKLDARQTAGYAVLVDMILEKGSQSSFRLVYQRLRRDWDLDGAYEEHLHADYLKPQADSRRRRYTYPSALLEVDEYV